jgi:RNA polymerase I-specific transcription initiation factor RRN7
MALTLSVAEQILELFPLQEVSPRTTEDTDDEKRDERLKQIQRSSILRYSKPVQEGSEQDVTRPGEYYRRYRTVEELSKEARVFYEIACKFLMCSGN